MKFKSITKEELERLCKESKTNSEVVRKVGLKPSSGNLQTFKNKIRKFKIDCSHFLGQS